MPPARPHVRRLNAQLNRATLRTLFLDLSRLAGGPGNVYNYCFRYLNSLSWAKGERTYPTLPVGGYGGYGYPGVPGDRGPGYPGTGYPGGGYPGGGNSQGPGVRG